MFLTFSYTITSLPKLLTLCNYEKKAQVLIKVQVHLHFIPGRSYRFPCNENPDLKYIRFRDHEICHRIKSVSNMGVFTLFAQSVTKIVG